jgi:hypothetical protein
MERGATQSTLENKATLGYLRRDNEKTPPPFRGGVLPHGREVLVFVDYIDSNVFEDKAVGLVRAAGITLRCI